MELRIRQAVVADVARVAALLTDCVAAMRAVGIEQWDEVYPTAANVEADLAAGSLFVAEADGKVVGTMTLDGKQSKEYAALKWEVAAERVMVVHRLAVLPGHWGQGVARRMMEFAEAWGSSQGFEAVRLDAFCRNAAAVKLYEKLGYRRAGKVVFRKGEFWGLEKRL